MFKRPKNIENAQKKLIMGDDNESIYYTPRSQFDNKEDDKDKIKQQSNNIDTKPSNNAFDYSKSLSQKAKDLMNKIKDANDDIDKYKLVFIGSNRKKN